MAIRLALASMASLTLIADGHAQEAPLTDWHIAGSNTTKFEYYEEDGYTANSIYPYDFSQGYNETTLSLQKVISPYETVSISGNGVFSGSDYRTADEGFTLEDLRASWQKGDAAFAPFRLDLGDYTESLSYRTLQQNLKGVQLEIQPTTTFGGWEQRNSIIAFHGTQQQDYRDLDLDRNIFSGGSWLTDLGDAGLWALHFVNNYRGKELARSPLPSRDQQTWGATFEKVFQLFKQTIGIEAEVDRFSGDYETFLSPTGLFEDRDGTGYFFKMNGSDPELDYGFRFEQYGEDYRPYGAVITPNRQTLSWTAGRKIFQDIRLDARVERFRDDLESEFATDTKVEGLAFSGPLPNPLLPDLSGYFSVSRESLNSESRLTDIRTWSYVGDFNAALYQEWTGHFSFNLRNVKDDGFEYGAIYREFTEDIGRPFFLGDAAADWRVGITTRENSGLVTNNDVSPFTSFSLAQGGHHLSLRTNYLFEDSHREFGEDVSSFSCQGGYSFTTGPHRFAVDVDAFSRNPYQTVIPSNQDYRVAFTYTLSFDKPVGTDIRDFSWQNGYRPPQSVLEDIEVDSPAYEISALEAAMPGRPLAAVQGILKARGIERPRKQGNFYIYEERIFKDIHWRQRLVLEEKEGKILRSAVLIDLDPAGNPAKSAEAYELVRGVLLKRYQNPSADISEGAFIPGYATAVNAGTLVRATEWADPNGAIRFGIPPQFGQPMRMEIHFAQTMSESLKDRWALEL